MLRPPTPRRPLASHPPLRWPTLYSLRLYGDEEGWHRQLLTEFIAYLGGEIRPMGPTTSTFYKLYGRAERHETIVLTNLMFETIGATTYRLALRTAKKHPAIRQMLTILTHDESFHVPLNVHFLSTSPPPSALPPAHRRAHGLRRREPPSRQALRQHPLQDARARLRRAPLGRLFTHAGDFGLQPPRLLLATVGLKRSDLREHDDVLSVDAAIRAADRSQVVVEAL